MGQRPDQNSQNKQLHSRKRYLYGYHQDQALKTSVKGPAGTLTLLKLYKEEQDREREKIGSKWIDHDRLFVKWNGLPMNNNTPYGWFREFCEKNEIRFCDIHSMRHYNASALIAAGVDIGDRIRNAWAFYGQHNGEYLLPRYAGGKGESQCRSCKLT